MDTVWPREAVFFALLCACTLGVSRAGEKVPDAKRESNTPSNVPTYRDGRLKQFEAGGRRGFLVEPTGRVDERRRWLWFVSCWHAVPRGVVEPSSNAPGDRKIHHQYYVESALEHGFHVAGVDVGITLGSPRGTAACQAFYERVVREFCLNPRVRLVGQSNGGLIVYNWAARHPHCVDRIAGIFPVTDLRSWPGLERACGTELVTYPELGYELTPPELSERLAQFNPIALLRPLATHRVKLFHVHGDRDQTVPFDANSGEVRRRYEALGGDIEIQVVAGGGHVPGPHYYESKKMRTFLLEDDVISCHCIQ